MKPSAQKLRDYRQNVAQFAFEQCGFEPDAWQRRVFDAFPSQDPERMRIAMKACAGPGKTAGMAICGWNFLACYGRKGLHPKGVAVSITGENLASNLWPEMSVWQQRSEYLRSAFVWQKTRIFSKEHPETWFLQARAFPKTADPEQMGRTLSGFHAGFILYMIDECGDIHPAILRSAEQGLASSPQWAKILTAGNPTSHTGMLYHVTVNQPHRWLIITITGDPDDPERSSRIDLEWARKQIEDYGRENPWVMAYILGQFPPSGLNSLLSAEDVNAAMKRHLREEEYSFAQRRIGVDAAGGGMDPWVIFPRQGLCALKPVVMRNPKPSDVAARVALAKKNWNSELEFFDDTGGWASGAIDHLIQAGYSPQPVNFAGKAPDPRYLNMRAWMWFQMAEWVKRGGALPNVPELVTELVSPLYGFQRGRFILEEKEQIKKRLGRSTNHADALSLTFALPEMPATVGYGLPELEGAMGRLKKEYDPLKED